MLLDLLRKADSLLGIVKVAVLKQVGEAMLPRLLSTKGTVHTLTDVSVKEVTAKAALDNRADERELEAFLDDNAGWFYLSTILDDFSRYIVAWKLCGTMKVGDVTETLNLALQASGLDHARVVHRLSSDLAEWLDKRNMGHVRGAPCHPQTQGKIERWHQTLKNRILLEHYYLPGDLEARIEAFVADYNHLRYHESIGKLS